jgi:hypothetical protein
MACSYCKRTDGSHSKGCRKKDGCKLCARVAPKKCKHHAKSQGGGRPSKPASRNGSGVIDALDVEIGTLEGRLEILRQARTALAG